MLNPQHARPCGARRPHFLTLCAICGVIFFAIPPGVLRAQGLAEPWDVAVAAQNMALQAARLEPLLDQPTPLDWEAGPATATYVRQVQSARDEVRYLVGAAQNLSKQPEKLSLALETYFRLQAVENQVASVAEGVRRYQNQAIADSMLSVMSANGANREQLRQYISDLAATREQEYRVVDGEAQRCRGTLLRQPAVPSTAQPAAKPVGQTTSQPTSQPAAAPPSVVPSANQPKGSR